MTATPLRGLHVFVSSLSCVKIDGQHIGQVSLLGQRAVNSRARRARRPAQRDRQAS